MQLLCFMVDIRHKIKIFIFNLMHHFAVTLISALFLQMIVIILVQLIPYCGTSGKLTSFYCLCKTIVVDFEKN